MNTFDFIQIVLFNLVGLVGIALPFALHFYLKGKYHE